MDSGCLSNLVSLQEFPPRLVANPAVTQKGSQFVSGAPTFRASTFRASQVSPGESTHIPCTSVLAEVYIYVGHRVSGTSL